MNLARKAIEGWSEKKWSPRGSRDAFGRVCLVARLCDVTPVYVRTWEDGNEYSHACQVVRDVLWEQYGTRLIGEWNDTPGRRFSEVVAVLEKTAVRLDEAI